MELETLEHRRRLRVHRGNELALWTSSGAAWKFLEDWVAAPDFLRELGRQATLTYIKARGVLLCSHHTTDLIAVRKRCWKGHSAKKKRRRKRRKEERKKKKKKRRKRKGRR